MRAIVWSVCGAVALACNDVSAAESGLAVPVSMPVATQGMALLRLVLALGAVLVAFWVFARVMRQLGGGRLQSNAGLSVVGALSLGQREKLVVVQAGGQQIVLGVTAQSINRLHVLDTPLPTTDTRADIADFRGRLQAALGRAAS